MDGPAEFVSGSLWDIHGLAFADIQVNAIGLASWGSVEAGGDNFIVFNNNRAIFAAYAGASLGYGFRNIQIILRFVHSLVGHMDFRLTFVLDFTQPKYIIIFGLRER